MISAIMALMAIAIDLMLPAFDSMRETYGLAPDSNRVSQVITAFFLGLAVAQLAWGPLADWFGRKKILYASLTIYVAGTVAAIMAPSFEWLLIARFFWGVGAAGTRVVSTAIIRDLFSGTAMAKAMSQIMAVFVLAPVFAPALGAGLISFLPWKSVFWFCALMVMAIGTWTLRLGETLNPDDRRPLEVRSIATGFRDVTRNRTTVGYTGATLFLQGVFTAYIGSAERIISGIYGRESSFALVFGCVAVLFGIGALSNGRLVPIFGIDVLIRRTIIGVLAWSWLLVAVTVASGGSPSFWLFLPMLGLLLATFMLLMPNLNTAALDPMGELAGTAASLTGASRIAGGALLGALVDARVSDDLTVFAVAVALFCAGAVGCVWWARGTLAPHSARTSETNSP